MIEDPELQPDEAVPSPYVGLSPYREEDAPFFFGRDIERDLIIANLRASKLTLFYGPSGVGKSSVLRAGVVYNLNHLIRQEQQQYGAPSFAIAYFKTWTESPIIGLTESIKKAFQDALQITSLESASDTGLCELCQSWTNRFNMDLLIILDQFEEYFLYHAKEKSAGSFTQQRAIDQLEIRKTVDAFEKEFPNLINRIDLRVRVLVSMREDAIAKLDKFKADIPILFDNRLHIEHMTTEGAKDAIEKPIARYRELFPNTVTPKEIKADLVEIILNELRDQQLGFSGTGQGIIEDKKKQAYIIAPYLQLVMERLWKEELKKKSPALRKETYEALGGANEIIKTHLNDVIAQLTEDEKCIAAEAFLFLVTREGTKISLSLSTLAKFTGRQESELYPVLDKLSSGTNRILNPVNMDFRNSSAQGYEIYHDALAPSILHWQTQFKADKQRAAELQKEQQEFLRKQREEQRRKGRIQLAVVLLIILFAVILSVYYLLATKDIRLELSNKNSAIVDLNIQLKKEQVEAEEQKSAAVEAILNDREEEFDKVVKELKSDNGEVRKNAVIKIEQLTKDPNSTSTIQSQIKPRVYLQLPAEWQREAANKIKEQLKGQGFLVPDIEIVGEKSPSSSQIRYYRQEDSDLANQVKSIIAGAGVKLSGESLQLKFISLVNSSAKIRPKHIEVWFSSEDFK